MISYLQSVVSDIDVAFKFINYAAVITALGYAFKIERRLSKLEGRLSNACKFKGCPLVVAAPEEESYD